MVGRHRMADRHDERSVGPALSGSVPLHSAGHSRGTDQAGGRLYNERLILSLIRRHGILSKVETAHLTGLSVQTAAGIMNRLEQDGLIRRQAPQRGRIGQPAVPFALDPEGAFSFGLKIGRRSCDLLLVDFVGRIRDRRHATYAYPVPGEVLRFVAEGQAGILESLSLSQRTRIAGLGIAIPFELWNWETEVGAPHEIMDRWRSFDIKREIAELCGGRIELCNDATAACAAELVFGEGSHYNDFLYLFIGTFIGGGVVLNGSLYPGRTGNAGAIGSMPVACIDLARGLVAEQLIRSASIFALENALLAAGKDPSSIWRSSDAWADVGNEEVADWIEAVATNIAGAIVAAASVIDFEAVIVDGALPAVIRARIVERTREQVLRHDWRGLSPIFLHEGSIGADARAVGGAALPLLANFARDREVLFKEPR
jgi:predicted NBD/HSP70 family sugar kinase